jgi:hypothetical protein
MFFSRAWLVLLGLAATAAFGVALLLPKPAAREISRAEAAGLDRAQHNAQMMLRLEARDWIDTAAKMSRDSAIVEALDQATSGIGDPAEHKARVEARLLALVGSLRPEARPELLIAVDGKGKQIARVGSGEGKFTPGKDGLAGYPVVEAALRGLRWDDSWDLDGKLYMVAGSPVISRAKGRYVGGLILGEELDSEFARRFKDHLGSVEVAFYLRGNRVGTTTTAPELAAIPSLYNDRKLRAEMEQKGRSSAQLVGQGGASRYVILTAIPGEAGGHDAFFAVAGDPVPTLGLGELLGLAGARDLQPDRFPWLLLGGLLFASLAIGLLLTGVEGSPVKRLEVDLQRLAKAGPADRLEESRYSGRFLRIVHTMNECLDHLHRRAPGGAGTDAGAGHEPPAVSPLLPLEGGGVKPLAIDLMGPRAASVPLGSGPGGAAPGESRIGGVLDEMGPGVRPLEGLELEEGATEVSTSIPSFGEGLPAASGSSSSPLVSSESDEEDVVADLAAARRAQLQKPIPGMAFKSGAFDGEPIPIPNAAEPKASAPRRAIRIPESELSASPSSAFAPPGAERGGSGLTTAETLMTSISSSLARTPEAVGTADELAHGEGEDLELYLRQTYKEFLAIKKQCGENTENLTFERFATKLRKNREEILREQSCTRVKFQVYIKDGKAALKATPIKE